MDEGLLSLAVQYLLSGGEKRLTANVLIGRESFCFYELLELTEVGEVLFLRHNFFVVPMFDNLTLF